MFEPDSEQSTKFLQIYFVDEDTKDVQLRCSNYPGVKQGSIQQFQRMLHNENKFIKDLKTTVDNIIVARDCPKFQVMIHADRKPANARIDGLLQCTDRL